MAGKTGDTAAWKESPYIHLKPGRTEGPPESQVSIREVQMVSGRGEVVGRP